jgi:hypothetical protein
MISDIVERKTHVHKYGPQFFISQWPASFEIRCALNSKKVDEKDARLSIKQPVCCTLRDHLGYEIVFFWAQCSLVGNVDVLHIGKRIKQ